MLLLVNSPYQLFLYSKGLPIKVVPTQPPGILMRRGGESNISRNLRSGQQG